jgi:nucleotide-binding universal stress UspA family protein
MHLSEKFNWSIHLVHTYTAIRNALAGADFVDEVQEGSLSRKQEQIQDLQAEISNKFPSVPLTTACIEGDLTRVILELIEENSYCLLVMGTKGAGKIKGATIGSNTFDLIQQSPIGVLAVPESHVGFKLQNLGVLTNFKESEFPLFRSFINRVNTPMRLVLLHTYESKEIPNDQDIQYWLSKFDHPLLTDIAYTQEEIVRRLDYNSPAPRCIERMIAYEDIDVLLVSYNRKSFFRQLFAKSLTKSIALNPSIPSYFMREQS